MLSYPYELRALFTFSICLVVIGLLSVYNVMPRISEGCQDSRR